MPVLPVVCSHARNSAGGFGKILLSRRSFHGCMRFSSSLCADSNVLGVIM